MQTNRSCRASHENYHCQVIFRGAQRLRIRLRLRLRLRLSNYLYTVSGTRSAGYTQSSLVLDSLPALL